MVTQTIRVNLNEKDLETILAVQSDSLREIAFDFYATDAEEAVQLDPDDFTVKFNVLKPDNNFVMTTFTDGVIKLSDQITAVTGTGYYCILLMQDDELIYSGNGKIIINDHVIGSENIDSVSEADGYTFPDDFYTKDTPLAVLDDNTTSTTSTWSSNKINGEINTASTSAIAQLNAMKTGFDGVVYPSPVEMVQSCDRIVDGHIDDLRDLLNDNRVVAQSPYAKEQMVLKADGTTQVIGQNYTVKYKLPDNTTRVFLTGYREYDLKHNYAYYWAVGDNNTVLDSPAVQFNPQEFNFHEIILPSGTKEFWTDSYYSVSIETPVSSRNAVASKILNDGMILKPERTFSGYMRTTGVIRSSPAGGIVSVYRVDTSVTKMALKGTALISAGFDWALVLFIKNGRVSGYVEPSANETVFTYDDLIDIPSGTSEIWVQNMNQFYGNNILFFADNGGFNIAKAVRDIQVLVSNYGIGQQWNGKKWYAYGTSITNTSNEGKYATYLAQMSGMLHTNKGISGGGIGNLGAYSHGQVYSAICNTTDGKTEADLITLETGANDIGADVPLGTIYDTGTSTLAGCLNDCIQYLQTNTNAQIAVTPSPVYKPADSLTQKYNEWMEMIEQICKYNRVHFLSPSNNMGWAKIASSSGSLYVRDQIHHTNLGGYIMAENLWYQLRNIPCFYTAMPT